MHRHKSIYWLIMALVGVVILTGCAGMQSVTPVGPIYEKDGRQCWDFTQAAEVNGTPQVIQGTACKRPAGESWDDWHTSS
jgi:hypothetical protein